jgi:hypothetical protein
MSSKQQLSERLDGHDVSGYPDEVVEFWLSQIIDAQVNLKVAGESRSFYKSQGVYDMDYFDSGYNYDGRLEDLEDVKNAARAWPKSGLGRFADRFEAWKKEPK